jgi:hypothetical protein
VGSVESVIGDPSVQPQQDGGEFAQLGGDVDGGEGVSAAPVWGRVTVEGFDERAGLGGVGVQEGDHLLAVAFGVVDGASIEAVAVAGQRLGRHGGAIALRLQGGRGQSGSRRRRGRGGMNAFSPGSVAPVSTNSPPAALE